VRAARTRSSCSGLDGGGDVAHRAYAGAFDLAGHDFAGPVLARGQVLVLQAGEVGAVAVAAGCPAEAAADGDALRVAGARLVEGAGDGGAPVDDEGRGGRVLGDPEPAQVVVLAGVVAGVRAESSRPKNSGPSGSSRSALA
jgi:hypothetical protein